MTTILRAFAIIALAYAVSPANGQSIDPAVTQAMICTKGYTATVRPDRYRMYAIKRKLMRAQHVTYRRILDHIVPLELGGAPKDLANLQLQTHAAAARKDKRENFVKRAVCSGRMTLAEGQAVFGAKP